MDNIYISSIIERYLNDKDFEDEEQQQDDETIKIDNELMKPAKLNEYNSGKEVFHIPNNKYTYKDAKAICKAYGARLANYDEVENAYNKGGEWCSYGWSNNQLALFPTQKKTYDELQKHKGHEHDCGRPGINGGFINNENVRYGINCFGFKPKMKDEDKQRMNRQHIYPKTEKEIVFENKVKKWKKEINNLVVAPFNRERWSVI